jgi:hypothetical protein
MKDRELMVLPLISGAITLLVAGSFAFGLGVTSSRVEEGGLDVYLPLFGMYVIAYTVGVFFQAAVVVGATDRMRGGDPTIALAMAAASRRIGKIVAWAQRNCGAGCSRFERAASTSVRTRRLPRRRHVERPAATR